MRAAILALVSVAIAVIPLISKRSSARAQTVTCPLSIIATLQLTEENQRLYVDTAINGVKMSMMLDTGWAFTSLTATTKNRLQLIEAPSSHKTNGIDGSYEAHDVYIQSFVIGGVPLAASTAHVAQMTSDEYNGVIGADFLSQYDVDFDFAGHRLTLYQPSGCAPVIDVGVPTTLPTAANFLSDNRIIVVARIDDKPVAALIDTGSNTLLVSKETAIKRLGVTEDDYLKAPTAPINGVARAKRDGHLITFHQLSIADIHADSATIEVAESDLNDFGLVVGMQYLKGQRFWVSYKYKRFIPLPTNIMPLRE